MDDKRFGDGLEEYALFEKIHPGYVEFQDRIAREVKKSILNIEKSNLLEVGVGTGTTLSYVSGRITNANIVAIDNEKKMLLQAEKNRAELLEISRSSSFPVMANNDITYLLTDAIKFTDYRNYFDAIYSAFTIHNFTDNERFEFFKNSYRSLKKNSAIIIGDKIAHNDEKLRHKYFNELISIYIDKFSKAARPDLAYKWTLHMAKDEEKGRIMIEDDMKCMMDDVGFKLVDTVYRKGQDAIVVGYKLR